MALLAYFTLLCGFLYVVVMPPILIGQSVRWLRHRGAVEAPVVGWTSMAGFLAGGAMAWKVLARGWELSLLTTIQAAADNQTWGHAIEHQAESLLVAVLFFAVAGSAFLTASTFLFRLRAR